MTLAANKSRNWKITLLSCFLLPEGFLLRKNSSEKAKTAVHAAPGIRMAADTAVFIC